MANIITYIFQLSQEYCLKLCSYSSCFKKDSFREKTDDSYLVLVSHPVAIYHNIR